MPNESREGTERACTAGRGKESELENMLRGE